MQCHPHYFQFSESKIRQTTILIVATAFKIMGIIIAENQI